MMLEIILSVCVNRDIQENSAKVTLSKMKIERTTHALHRERSHLSSVRYNVSTMEDCQLLGIFQHF